MKTELKPYPAYHTARVSWADSIPTTWETGWLGECSRTIQTGPFGSQLHAEEYQTDGVPIINPSNITASKVVADWEITVAEEKANELGRHRFKIGDLVFARRGEMGRCAAITETEEGWLCGTGSMLIRLKDHRLLPSFAVLMLSQSGIRDTLSLQSVGATMDNLNTHILAKLRFPLPPLDEQRAILAFLDQETAKIDRLMEVRRKQVERLQEQRTAVIHHAVTQGLDPNAKMKPSSVEWLPQVPEGWTVKRLKYWAKHISVQVSAMPEGHAYLALEHVESKTGQILPNEDAEFDSNVKLFKADDVLFGRLRPYLAKVALPDFDGVCVGELMVLRPNREELRPRYLQLRLLTPDFISLVDGSTQGAKMPRANWTFVGDIPLAFPPPDQQDAIIAHIERETAKLDTLAAKYRRELELLTEYRASLISHAVTGKIDVRGLVPT